MWLLYISRQFVFRNRTTAVMSSQALRFSTYMCHDLTKQQRNNIFDCLSITGVHLDNYI